MNVIHETENEEHVLVKDVMTSPVISVNENECIPLVASLMDHYPIECVMITNEEGEPVGIITEKELVVRVLTKITDESFVLRLLGGDARASTQPTTNKIRYTPNHLTSQNPISTRITIPQSLQLQQVNLLSTQPTPKTA